MCFICFRFDPQHFKMLLLPASKGVSPWSSGGAWTRGAGALLGWGTCLLIWDLQKLQIFKSTPLSSQLSLPLRTAKAQRKVKFVQMLFMEYEVSKFFWFSSMFEIFYPHHTGKQTFPNDCKILATGSSITYFHVYLMYVRGRTHAVELDNLSSWACQ